MQSNHRNEFFWSISEHISHSHTKKGNKHHSVGRGDKRTADGEKYDGSTQICGVPKFEHEDLVAIEQNRNSRLCDMVFLKRGCYKNVDKRIGGRILIDESYKSSKANYSDIMKE